MSRERIRQDAELLKAEGRTVQCIDSGETVVVVLTPYSLPSSDAYLPSTAESLAFVVPNAYPDAQPDASGFYLKPSNIKLSESKADPTNTSVATLLDQQWRKFSWAPKGASWDPKTDTLLTYLANIEKRFLQRK